MEFRYVLTNRCNFDCYFCLKEYDIEHDNKHINVEGFTLISKVASKNLGINEVTLTGGEPLLYNQFDKLVIDLNSLNNYITVVTNGYYLNEKLNTFKYIDELHVSFHSFNMEHWKRITCTNSQAMQRVIQNIIEIRNHYPSLRIKLNVVSEDGNNQFDSINEYLKFAKENNLEISVFKESYTTWAKKMKIKIDYYKEPADFWRIDNFDPIFIEKTKRKRNYIVKDVNVSLSNTSVDSIDKSSIWINEFGFAYSDIYRKSQTSLYNSVNMQDEKEIYSTLQNLIIK